MDTKERKLKRQARMFGGAVVLLLGADQFTQVHRYGGHAIFLGIVFLITGAGLIYFALRT